MTALTRNQLKREEQIGIKEQRFKTVVVARKHSIKPTSSKCPCPSGQDNWESLPIAAGKTIQGSGINSLALYTMRRQTLTSVGLSFVMSLMLAMAAVRVAGDVIGAPAWSEPASSVQVVPVQGDQVQDLCDAQCAAMCITLGDEVCEDICGKSGQRRSRAKPCSWLLKCQHSGCTGSCSTMPQTHTIGPVPNTPQVSVTRDVWTGQINISWPLHNPNGKEQIVYLVSQKTGYCSWAQLGWVIGNRYTVTNITDLCKLITYRVAAVSRFGSRWFSEEVETPVLAPGPPRDLKIILDSKHIADQEEAIFNLEWKPPKDWPLNNLQFDLLSKVDCPALIDEVYIYRDKSLVEVDLMDGTVYVVTGRIPLHAIGCTITFLVGSRPKCNSRPRIKAASIASTTITFECSALPDYKGDLCNVPPLGIINSAQGSGVYPSPVRNVTLVVLPVPEDRLLARVFWLPPERLGSAGYVETYHLFWGLVELVELDFLATFKKDIASTIVPGDQLTDELLLNISSFQPYETLGVVIQAAGPNQSIINSFSSIHKSANFIPPNYNFSSEDVIANDSTVYVIQTIDHDRGEPKVKVDVFWLRPELSLSLDVASYQVTLRPRYIHSSGINQTKGARYDMLNLTRPQVFDTTMN